LIYANTKVELKGEKKKTNATEKRRWEAVLKLPSFGAVSASQMGINGEGWGTIKRIQKKKKPS
jgi:hypothetical protein